MCERFQHEQHKGIVYLQTNLFRNHDDKHIQFLHHAPNSNPCRHENSGFTLNPHIAKRSYNPRNTTCSPINSYSNSHNPIPLYSHSLTSTYLAPARFPVTLITKAQSHSGITLRSDHPHTTQKYYPKNDQPSNQTHMINLAFYLKNNESTASNKQQSWREWLSKTRVTDQV